MVVLPQRVLKLLSSGLHDSCSVIHAVLAYDRKTSELIGNSDISICYTSGLDLCFNVAHVGYVKIKCKSNPTVWQARLHSRTSWVL